MMFAAIPVLLHYPAMLELAFVAGAAVYLVMLACMPFLLVWGFLAGLFGLPNGLTDEDDEDEGP